MRNTGGTGEKFCNNIFHSVTASIILQFFFGDVVPIPPITLQYHLQMVPSGHF